MPFMKFTADIISSEGMSLVRPQDQYVRSYGDPKFYTLTGNGDTSATSTPILKSGDNTLMYKTESFSSESYDLNSFFNSPIEELDYSPSSNNSLSSSSHQVVSQNSYDYDEDQIRLKLQELERALLDDNKGNGEENDDFTPDEYMEIDTHNMLHDSPKESTSSDSNHSTISSNKEVSIIKSISDPKQLLFQCAKMISDGNIVEASKMISDLRNRVSIQGDPSQRISAYMVEALAARVEASGKGLYKALKCKEPPTNERLSSMQVLFEVCPCFRFGFMAANASILEACKDEKRVHIVDFDINQGSQYYTLIEALAKSPFKPTLLRLTGVDDPESVQRSIGGLELIGTRLEILAHGLKVPFEFKAVASKTEIVSPEKLECKNGEVLIVNFAFQLHHMPDESVSTINQRDQLLRMVKSMNPKLVTVVEQEINTNTAPFFPRFIEAYNYYSAVFETLEATLPRDSQDRLNVEKQCLARDIVNIVACEGEERIERYEVAGKWRARMMMAGFSPCPVSNNVSESIRKLIKQYSERFKVKEETGGLHFSWEDKVLIVASAWM